MSNYEENTLDNISEDVKKLHRLLVKEDQLPTYQSEVANLRFNTGYQSQFERNRIVFGAPGTGKSYRLKIDCETLISDTKGTYERVTFHPDYSYAHFVGTYKPVSDESNSEIKYEFVPGPFMRVYIDAH